MEQHVQEASQRSAQGLIDHHYWRGFADGIRHAEMTREQEAKAAQEQMYAPGTAVLDSEFTRMRKEETPAKRSRKSD